MWVAAAPWMQGNATRSVAPVSVAVSIAHSAGQGTSTAFSNAVFVDNDTGTPSFTRANAALRLAGVIKLSVPISSSFPQRPQLDNSFCQAANGASLTRGREGEPCEAASPAIAAVNANEKTRIETALENTGMLMISPRSCGIRPNATPRIPSQLTAHKVPNGLFELTDGPQQFEHSRRFGVSRRIPDTPLGGGSDEETDVGSIRNRFLGGKHERQPFRRSDI